LSEPGDVAGETAQKKEGAPPRKKGSAKGKGKDKLPSDHGTSPLTGKKYAASVTNEQKKADKIKADAMKPAARKKGGAKHHGNMPKKGSGDHKEGHKGGAKHHGNMPKKKGSGDHKDGHKGSANYKEGYPPAGSGKKKGASKKKGSADFKGGLHAKNTKHSESGEHLGAKKAGAAMGFTQNFGPARQNSYARGAAKVNEIMGKGAYKKGAADSGHGANPGHKHDRYISPERLKSNIEGSTSADMGMDLNEVVVSANANNKKSNKKRKNPKVKSIYKTQITGVNAPVIGGGTSGYGKGGAFHNSGLSMVTGYSRINPVFSKKKVKRSPQQIERMRSRGITFKEDS
jgi:hypothetical protein